MHLLAELDERFLDDGVYCFALPDGDTGVNNTQSADTQTFEMLLQTSTISKH